MSDISLTAYLAVPSPYALDKDYFADLQDGALRSLAELSGSLPFPMQPWGTPMAAIEALDEFPADEFDLWQLPETRDWEECRALAVSIQVEQPLTEHSVSAPVGTKSTEPTARSPSDIFAVAMAFADCLRQLVYVTNIARVGSLSTKGGIVSQDGRLVHTLFADNAHVLRERRGVGGPHAWPVMSTLDICSVWDWAQRQPGFAEGFGGGPLGRALNAYTHLFAYPSVDELLALFWSLVGIEALYNAGRERVCEQLKQKICAFLGGQLAPVEMIGQMYRFRSRFIHGRLDFPGRVIVSDIGDELARSDTDVENAGSLAVAILVATLQEIARRDWSFETFAAELGGAQPGQQH